jgi:hypothetical protein
MDMDQAAVFLAGSVLTALGGLVILGAVLIANNLIAKYWKTWGWQWMPHWANDPPRFVSEAEAEKIAPTMDKKVNATS